MKNNRDFTVLLNHLEPGVQDLQLACGSENCLGLEGASDSGQNEFKGSKGRGRLVED